MTGSGDEKKVRWRYVVFGVIVGTVVSSWYLYRNITLRTGPGLTTTPDPPWALLVNIVLIYFVTVYQSVLIYRLVSWLRGKKGGQR